jgi:hypothetical protein
MLQRAPLDRWLARVRHDLVKRMLWAARDCRELGKPPVPGELLATLYDSEGRATDAATLWTQLRDDFPAPPAPDSEPSVPEAAALEAFGMSVERCAAAAASDDLDGVLQLELEFERLRSALAPSLNATAHAGRWLGKDP